MFPVPVQKREIERIVRGESALVIDAAGEAWKWTYVRGNLVIDKPTTRYYNEKTAASGEGGELVLTPSTS